jgi:DNA-directed RNA polymerase specialized sigma24 family protein
MGLVRVNPTVMLVREQGVRAHEDFASFYHETRDKCLRAVYASTGDVHRAEDLVAEAYARALARWPRVSGHPAPAAWIVRTALNLHVSWWRRGRREYAIGGLRGHRRSTRWRAAAGPDAAGGAAVAAAPAARGCRAAEGPGWTKEPDGTYKIFINLKALGPSRVQPITITKGY